MKPTLAVFFLASLLSCLAAAQSKQENSALLTVVESERAFARKSLDVGSRAAFMLFFADDAVVFRPHPVKYKEAMKNAPPVKNPLETTLEWEPIWADVSSDGDLGYTTGPFGEPSSLEPPYGPGNSVPTSKTTFHSPQGCFFQNEK